MAKRLADYEEMLRVLDSCFARIKWRIKPLAKRCLKKDILILCTGVRPVALVDYDGQMPKLQENLSQLLFTAQKESIILQDLRVLILQDMAYLFNVKELAQHISSSLDSKHKQLILLDLEQSPLKILSPNEENENAAVLLSIQKFFSAAFPVGVDIDDHEPAMPSPIRAPIQESIIDKAVLDTGSNKKSSKDKAVNDDSSSGHSSTKPTVTIDLSYILRGARIVLPSLNGWLLGYPITYLFSEEHGEKSTTNLSKHSLMIFKVFISRKQTSSSAVQEEELMSFSVPKDLCLRLDKEPWMVAFLARINEKVKRCNQVWASMRLDIDMREDFDQIVVL